MDQNCNIEICSLLQPELLSEVELREILAKRCVSRNLFNLSRNELVDLFRTVALPLPQREYGKNSWRERLLAKKQKRHKRAISFSNSDDVSSKSEPVRKQPRVSEDKSSPQDRLKPPPAVLPSKKVIKLPHSSSSRSKGDLDKVVIVKKQKTEPYKDDSIVLNKSGDNGKSISIPNTMTSSKVKLKRDSIPTKDEKKEESKADEAPSKKKRQKIVISW